MTTSSETVKTPLLADLFPDGIPYGTALIIEFDADSSYYQLLESVVHDLLSSGYIISFFDYTRFPDEIRRDLKSLGSDLESLEARGLFRLYDGYSATIGVRSKGLLAFSSLKVADLSLAFLKMTKDPNPVRHDIGFSDNGSIAMRYNDEKTFVEFYATRVIPRVKIHDRISFSGFVNGVHSNYLYRSMEDLVDGVIDITLDVSSGTPYTKLRVRNFKKGAHSASWMRVKFDGPHATLINEKA